MSKFFLRVVKLGLRLEVFLILANTLAGCGSEPRLNTAEAATPKPTTLATLITTPKSTTLAAPSPTATATADNIVCGKSVDYIQDTVAREVFKSRLIFAAQVTKIGALIWNTPDGNAPTKSCDNKYEQYAQVELTLQAVYKGSQTPGSKLTVLLAGAPGAKPFGAYSYRGDFPKLNAQYIWFLGEDYNYRSDQATNPFNYLAPLQIYKATDTHTWSSLQNNNKFELADLQEIIRNPPPDPTFAPVAPTPTASAKVGQKINLFQLYKLNKADYVYMIKSLDTDVPIYTPVPKVVAAFDVEVAVLSNPTVTPPATLEAQLLLIGLHFPDGSNQYFYYDRQAGTLEGFLPDRYNQIKVTAPPALLSVLGLK